MGDERYDVVVVGAGPAGIFASLELAEGSDLSVLLLEKGDALEDRDCPARRHGCVSCPTCDVMSGWGGAGAFSDGKLTLSSEVGGNLADYLAPEALESLISHTDERWLEFGAPRRLYGPDPEEADRLSRQAVLAGMRLIPMPIRHMGTDRSPAVLALMRDRLTELGVEMRVRCEAAKVLVDGSVRGVELVDGETVEADRVILAPGRDGAEWLAAQARVLGIGLANNAVDVGVRVEAPAVVMEPLTEALYEAKLIYHSRQFGDEVRTFCMNPYGEVTTESYGDITTVNGHSYAERTTQNTNFAVLVSKEFTEPFDDPITYGTSIARLANLLGERILVQRLGDLRDGRRSTPRRLERSLVRPTLSDATPGDLSFVLPYRHLSDILEFIEALDRLAPGIASPGTLLYGVEVKFYSSRLDVDERLRTEIDGLYAIGDGAGITRGLVQSSASGVLAARAILDRAD